MKKTFITAISVVLILIFSAIPMLGEGEFFGAVDNLYIPDLIYNEIPTEKFGGMYWETDGEILHVNVTDESEIKLGEDGEVRTHSGIKIYYHLVEKSLAELEAAHEALIPFMKEYGIATLDADDVNNTVNIELYYDHPTSIEEVEALAAQFIDLEYVNITIFPEGTKIVLTTEKIPKQAEISAETEAEISYLEIFAMVFTPILVIAGTIIVVFCLKKRKGSDSK